MSIVSTDVSVKAADIDSLWILPLAVLPLKTPGLRKVRLMKSNHLEGVVEMFASDGAGSGHIRPLDLSETFADIDTGDTAMIEKLAALHSYDVYTGHCHCIDCRKTSGTGHASHMGIPADALTVTGDVKFFDAPTDSGNTVSRGFCPTCGSALYSTNSIMPEHVFVRASSLDDPELFVPQFVVYTSRAASWDKMDPSLPAFEEMPPPEAMHD